MAETDVHRQVMIDTIETRRTFFRDRTDVYVSGNLLLYYEQGNPAAAVAPDTFVVFGTESHQRRIYKLWEEGQAPAVVIEFTSRSTLKHARWLSFRPAPRLRHGRLPRQSYAFRCNGYAGTATLTGRSRALSSASAAVPGNGLEKKNPWPISQPS